MSSEKPGPEMSVVASLRFEVPINDVSPTVRSGGGGTLDLADVPSEGPVVEETVTLREGETFRVGRARNNDLVLQNNSVSRFHAVFSASRSGLVLSDLSSTNGTFHNGRVISTPVNLVSGDEVRIGHVKISTDLHLGQLDEDSMGHMQTQANEMRAMVVTVLVADVASFTSMSQALPPKDVADMLDTWFGDVTEIVRGHGGEIDKYIGDCVMALWRGSYADAGEGAVQSIEAADKILTRTVELGLGWQHNSVYPWRCRVALNTGDALFGSVGGKGAREFTVLGDTVNIAFRLEGVGAVKGWDLIMSEATAERAKDRFALQCMGPVIIEGRKDTINAYTLAR